MLIITKLQVSFGLKYLGKKNVLSTTPMRKLINIYLTYTVTLSAYFSILF